MTTYYTYYLTQPKLLHYLTYMSVCKSLEYGDNVEGYVSVYDKPRKMGRPKIYTDEELRLKRTEHMLNYYYKKS